MPALSILVTNNTLSWRAGSELWVRDICGALVARGHHPIAFSLVTGAVAEELRAATVPVVSDLSQVGVTPDLIHGHHHLETLIAALHFPGVPIVHFCHGWLPWEEGPLRHPSIVRYVAVDETCADRLTAENGIGRDQVDLLLNFVDLQRFQPRGPLPSRPRRAIVFSNGADEDGFAATIHAACREQDIELEIAGSRSGRSVDRPQELLPAFDLVFAKARSALEAMAVGCSVILADTIGAGPLVSERDFDRLRAGNFGVRWLQHAHSLEWYRAQIAAYDAAEAGRIAARVRVEADLEGAVDRLLVIYRRAIDQHRLGQSSSGRTGEGCIDASRAAARHLSSVAIRFKQAQDLNAAVQTLSGDLAAARADRVRLVRERQQLLMRADALADQHASERASELSAARSLDHHLAVERDNVVRLEAAVQTLSGELATSYTDRDHGRREHQALMERVEALANETAAARSLSLELGAQREQLQQLVESYRTLPTLRLRDAVIRLPILGAVAQRVARWLTGAASSR